MVNSSPFFVSGVNLTHLGNSQNFRNIWRTREKIRRAYYGVSCLKQVLLIEPGTLVEKNVSRDVSRVMFSFHISTRV